MLLVLAAGGCGDDGEGGEAGEDPARPGPARDVRRDTGRRAPGSGRGSRLRRRRVGNTTTGTLQNARVEFHLSNDIELGPVVIGDLVPREMRDVEVIAMRDELMAAVCWLDAARASQHQWRQRRQAGSRRRRRERRLKHGSAGVRPHPSLHGVRPALMKLRHGTCTLGTAAPFCLDQEGCPGAELNEAAQAAGGLVHGRTGLRGCVLGSKKPRP